MMTKLHHWHDLAMTRVFDRLRGPLLLILRLYIGWQFAEAGWGKLHNIQSFAGFLASLGIPMPGVNAWFVASLEYVGGMLLLVGLASRMIAIPLSINMIVAYLTADHDAVINVFHNPDAFIAATPFLFLLVSLIVLAFGPGVFSIDALIGRVSAKRGTSPDEKGVAAAAA